MAGFADALQRRNVLTHRDPAQQLTELHSMAHPHFIFKHSRRFSREPLYDKEPHGPAFQNRYFLKKFTTAFPSMSRQLQTMMGGGVMQRRWNRTWGTVARRRTRVVMDEHRDRLTATHTLISPDRIQRAAYYHRLNDLDHWLAVDQGHFSPQPGASTVRKVNAENDTGWDLWRVPHTDFERSDILHGEKKQKLKGPRASASPNRLMTIELTTDVSQDVIEMRQNRQKEGWIDTSPHATWVSHLHIAVLFYLTLSKDQISHYFSKILLFKLFVYHLLTFITSLSYVLFMFFHYSTLSQNDTGLIRYTLALDSRFHQH